MRDPARTRVQRSKGPPARTPPAADLAGAGTANPKAVSGWARQPGGAYPTPPLRLTPPLRMAPPRRFGSKLLREEVLLLQAATPCSLDWTRKTRLFCLTVLHTPECRGVPNELHSPFTLIRFSATPVLSTNFSQRMSEK